MFKRVMIWVGVASVAMALAILIAVSTVFAVSEMMLQWRYDVPLSDFQIETHPLSFAAGKRLALLRGCFGDCHGETLEGRIVLDEPGVARITAPNLTDSVHWYSDAELERAIRRGVKRDGSGMFLMPADVFYNLKDDDLSAIVSFLRSVPPIRTRPPGSRFSFRGRLELLFGGLAPVTPKIDQSAPRLPDPDPDDAVAFGRYLVVTMCAECHAPTVASSRSEAELGALLREGTPPDLDHKRYRNLTGPEVRAIHAYLSSP